MTERRVVLCRVERNRSVLMRRNKSLVILYATTVPEARDNFAAERIQLGLEKLRKTFIEKLSQHRCSSVIGFLAHFGLCVHLQKPARNHAAFDMQRVRRVTEQRTARGANL